tara:strand:- start:192 stop:599 length:408 start_codon:yes stop_codon:yes gene_type:complete
MSFNYSKEVSKIEDVINEIEHKLLPGHGGYMKYYIHSHYHHSKYIFDQIPELSEGDTLLEIGTYIGLPFILAKEKFGCNVLVTDTSVEIKKNKYFHKINDLKIKFPLWGKILSLILSLFPKYGESIVIVAKKPNT